MDPGTDPARWPVAVMGAGAVGCYYGAMLARAGHPVTLIGRPSHVSAIAQAGLQIESQAFSGAVALGASTEPSAVRGARLVLCCVKSTDTVAAGHALAPFLAADATVLSLQNGVDNADRLSQVLGRAVLPAVVYVATEMTGPGRLVHHGRGDLVIGEGRQAAALAALFAAAGVPVQVSPNVAGALWAKLIVNCAYNALSAITRLPYGRLVAAEPMPAVVEDLVDECLAVARAAGVDVPADIRTTVRAIPVSMAGQQSSTAQDLARGKPTEIDHLNGFVVREGAARGVRTPLNRLLLAAVKAIEAR